ncbi:Gfo/Idh/MocA family oxidoreductase [Patescibacteria group bacterium]|nr:Gfo/Idh/MocA family oxidoreductase [Patescibacteria group bacterium]
MVNKTTKISNGMNKRFAIIGKGFIFKVHSQAIAQIGGEIVEVVDESNGQDAWRDMIKNTDADCIVILTPNDLHFGMIMAAVEQGKIVLCEKPLVVNSEQARILVKKPNIFTVLQLRYHPLVKDLKSKINKSENHKINMDISVYRDEKYYQGWKGQKEKSGGLLFNLGIHYFDLLQYLFGEEKRVTILTLNEKTGRGIIEGGNYICNWKVSTGEKKDNQRRVFKINGTDYNFSSKDNLSYENLHTSVYQDLLNKKGITPEEALKSIMLVEKLYASSKK